MHDEAFAFELKRYGGNFDSTLGLALELNVAWSSCMVDETRNFCSMHPMSANVFRICILDFGGLELAMIVKSQLAPGSQSPVTTYADGIVN